ncbi:unnamed protein product [Toxocara canis]|uniref:Fuz_longin_2 domain-containing protein n=1 Tax=Toxocara canis TaxID=6265 RepID=A0A183V0G7_TOXCA|nr:unnamed protein product [Toxocara canis]
MFQIPTDCSRFAWLMLRSKFISCDHNRALKFREENAEIFNRKPYIDPKMIISMAKLRDWAIDHGATPMLSSWLRECDIIYHTYDVDFAFFSHEYYDEMIKDIQETTFMQMNMRLNFPEDLLELKVFMLHRNVDIFFIYNNGTVSWIGGLDGTQRYRFIYPLIKEVCSTILLDYLMYVPCNALDVIKADYGDEWTKLVHSSKYHWNLTPHSVQMAGRYTQQESKNAIQQY